MYYYFCNIPAAVVVQHDLTSFVYFDAEVVHVWFLRWVHVLPLYHLHTFIMQMSDYYLQQMNIMINYLEKVLPQRMYHCPAVRSTESQLYMR